MNAMSGAEVDEALTAMPGWVRDDATIRKEFRRKGFAGAVAFAQRIVEPANTANHHPDLDIRYNRVIVSLSTHDVGGITEEDLALARTIDALSAAD